MFGLDAPLETAHRAFDAVAELAPETGVTRRRSNGRHPSGPGSAGDVIPRRAISRNSTSDSSSTPPARTTSARFATMKAVARTMAASAAPPGWFSVSMGPRAPTAIATWAPMAFMTVLGKTKGESPRGPRSR